MPDNAKSNVYSEDFESWVKDSVEPEMENGVENCLDSLAHNNLMNQDEFPAQEGTSDLDGGVGPDGPGSGAGVLGHIPSGPNCIGQEKIIGYPIIPEGEGREIGETLEAREVQVRCSQLPGLNLVVDLHDASCRRRRRRQLSTLASISETLESNPETEAIRPSPSLEESFSTNPEVVREALATMAVGGELGINFRPNDDLILCKMIELEAQELSQTCERVNGG